MSSATAPSTASSLAPLAAFPPVAPPIGPTGSRRCISRRLIERGQAGSATVWTVAMIMLASGVTGYALVWIAAVAARHSAEKAADRSALAAAGAAVHGRSIGGLFRGVPGRDGGNPDERVAGDARGQHDHRDRPHGGRPGLTALNESATDAAATAGRSDRRRDRRKRGERRK